jgi:DnaJ-class molecular chaperone
MPATFGVTDTYGQIIPTGGYAQTVEDSSTVEVATIKDETGQVKVAQAKPRKMQTVTIKSKGVASLSTVVNGDMGSSLAITGAKFSQTNDDFSTSEVTLTLYS